MSNRIKLRKAVASGSFEELFRIRLNQIEASAKAAGSKMTIVCKLARISRAGPVRWHNEVPQTVKIMDRMSAAVEELIKSKAAKGSV